MAKKFYLVRHGNAKGQEPDAVLTEDGCLQAEIIADLLRSLGINRIVSSTFRRAVDSIRPLAKSLELPIETDVRLIEASLSAVNYPDWIDRLKATFDDYDLSYDGGESSRDATARAVASINDVLTMDGSLPVIVSHGRLLSLLLRHLDKRYGFEFWQALTSPDIFSVIVQDSGDVAVTRLWH